MLLPVLHFQNVRGFSDKHEPFVGFFLYQHFYEGTLHRGLPTSPEPENGSKIHICCKIT